MAVLLVLLVIVAGGWAVDLLLGTALTLDTRGRALSFDY